MSPETPRNGVLAQYFGFVERMTNKNHTVLQQVIGAAAALVPLCAVLALVIWLVTSDVHRNVALLSVGAATLCGSGMVVTRRVRRRRQRMLDAANGSTADPEPGQNSVGEEPGTERDKSADEDRQEVSDGAG